MLKECGITAHQPGSCATGNHGASQVQSACTDCSDAKTYMDGSLGMCIMCLKPAEVQCSRCKGAWYCGKVCQRKHWPTHKCECTPYANAKPVVSQIVGDSHPVAAQHNADAPVSASTEATQAQPSQAGSPSLPTSGGHDHGSLLEAAKAARQKGNQFYYFPFGGDLRSDLQAAPIGTQEQPAAALHQLFHTLEDMQAHRLESAQGTSQS